MVIKESNFINYPKSVLTYEVKIGFVSKIYYGGGLKLNSTRFFFDFVYLAKLHAKSIL